MTEIGPFPASAWTEQQRAQYLAAGQAMRGAAAQTVGLVKLTPHRVMRELYEQFIAYARAYAQRIPNYIPADNNLVGTATSASCGSRRNLRRHCRWFGRGARSAGAATSRTSTHLTSRQPREPAALSHQSQSCLR